MTEPYAQERRSSDGAPHSRIDAIFKGAAVTALLLLTFVGGAIVTAGDVFPGPQIARAYQGGKALYDQIANYRDIFTSDLWPQERRSERGVTVHAEGLAQDGVTLYTSGHEAAAYLIDMKGEVLHEWRRPFSQVWAAGSGAIKRPMPDSHVYFRNARVFPNGDLLVIYESVGDTPYGYGIAKLDRNSEVIWSYPGRAHHQLDIAPDGKIYALTHEIVDDVHEGLRHLARPRLEDFLVVLSPDGEELKKIRLIPAIAGSPFSTLLHRMPGFSAADPLHANAVTYIDGTAAANFPFGREGQVLLSLRETNTLMVLDPETEAVTWATDGYWIGQHDPDILANGNILLFDNYGHYDRPEGLSRVIEIDPRSMAVVWQYAGTAENPLASEIRADQQRLPNGNTLINESSGGRLVEVTHAGEVVWEFINPVRNGPDGNQIPIIGWAMRLDPADLDPALLEPPQPAPSRKETDL